MQPVFFKLFGVGYFTTLPTLDFLFWTLPLSATAQHNIGLTHTEFALRTPWIFCPLEYILRIVFAFLIDPASLKFVR